MMLVECALVIISYAALDYIMVHGYSWWATTEHDMTRIHGIAALSGRTYESVRHALELFVDAGCPREDRDHTGRKAFAYVRNDEHKETVSLFPPLPDRFAGKTRAEVRAMYDAGVRQWSYVEFWTAWLSGQ